MSLRVFIGHDGKQKEACAVADRTLRYTSGITAEWLHLERLRDYGLLTRPTDRRGVIYDLISNAPCSTDFAISRFLVPILCQSGWALFCDCDVVFMRDVREILDEADDRFAILVVKHEHDPVEATKMNGQPQTSYARKNQSSIVLWNCDHAANKRLSLHDVNFRPGLWLHQFSWLNESEIGELSGAWNWLVNVGNKPSNPAIAHYTLGVPIIPGYEHSENSEIWWGAYRQLKQ